MKSHELPGNPDEHSALLREATDIACHDAAEDGSRGLAGCGLEAAKRRIAALSIAVRASNQVLALVRTAIDRAVAGVARRGGGAPRERRVRGA